MDTNNSTGKKSLDERLESEAQFHDAKYSGADSYPRHYAVNPTAHVYQQMLDALGDIQDKTILEYGCGEGWITRDLAERGAEVCGFDVSATAVESTRRVLESAGLAKRCRVDVMAAERLNYPDQSFDMAVGFAIIHHLDLPPAIEELHRVLKPGGVAYFAEPLESNPLIRLYRRSTPQFRTEDERPLVLAEMPDLFSKFRKLEHREFFLTALLAVGLAYLPGGARIYPSVSSLLHGLDRVILRMCPRLGSLAWYSVIKITK